MSDASRDIAHEPVIRWLLAGDAAVRWQVFRDVLGSSAGEVAAARAAVAREGWGAALLAAQRPDGLWGDGADEPYWLSTLNAMVMLWELGVDPECEAAVAAVGRVAERVTWGPEFGDSPFFEGEVEPCINGRVLGLGAYFHRPSAALLARLLSEQLADGGWNCEAERGSVRSSFHSTICVLEGLLAYEQHMGPAAAVTQARQRGEAYLIARRMHRRLSTGEVIRDRKSDADWADFAFPATWHYDVLRGLDYLRAAGVPAQPDVAEALGMVAARRRDDGTWRHIVTGTTRSPWSWARRRTRGAAG